MSGCQAWLHPAAGCGSLGSALSHRLFSLPSPALPRPGRPLPEVLELAQGRPCHARQLPSPRERAQAQPGLGQASRATSSPLRAPCLAETAAHGDKTRPPLPIQGPDLASPAEKEGPAWAPFSSQTPPWHVLSSGRRPAPGHSLCPRSAGMAHGPVTLFPLAARKLSMHPTARAGRCMPVPSPRSPAST